MSNILLNKSKKLSKFIGYSIIGAYAKGASEAANIKLKGVKSNKLGMEICRAENFDILNINIDANNKLSSPDKMNYLKNLIDIATTEFSESVNIVLNNETIVSSEKENIIINKANNIAKEMGVIAFGEGLVDDELKQDIQLILKEGKERFEKRMQETSPEEDAQVEQMAGLDDEMNPEMDGFEGMDGDPFATEGMPGEDDFLSNDLDLGEGVSDDDLIPDESQQDNSLGEAQDAMAEFDDKPEEEKVAESILFSASVKNKVAMAEKMGVSKETLNKVLNDNNGYFFADSKKYMYGENFSTMEKHQLNDIVDTVMSLEDRVFNKAASTAGAKIALSESFGAKTNEIVKGSAVIIATKHRLSIGDVRDYTKSIRTSAEGFYNLLYSLNGLSKK